MESAAQGAFGSTGQRCTATSRVIVEDSVADRFVDALAAHAGRVRVGNGLEAGVDMGPAVDASQLATDLKYIELGREEGRLVALAPLLVYPHQGRRTVAFCGGGVSDYCDVVTDPEGEDEAVAALFSHLAARRDFWEMADFEPVPGESPLLCLAPPDGLEARTEPRDACPGLDLPGRTGSSL